MKKNNIYIKKPYSLKDLCEQLGVSSSVIVRIRKNIGNGFYFVPEGKIKVKVKKGDRFGKLTLLEDIDKLGSSPSTSTEKIKFKCDCGNEAMLQYRFVKFGNTRSCGCISGRIGYGFSKEEREQDNYKYIIAMHRRYIKKYGVVIFSKEWMDIQNFVRDIIPVYEKGMSLLKIDKEKPLSCDNYTVGKWGAKK